MSRATRFIRMACQAAEKVDRSYVYRIGAVVAQGSRFLSYGCNSTKTHPKNPKLHHRTKKTQLCAEVTAAIRASRILRRRNLSGCSIYVARRKWGNGDVSMAKPCEFCMEFLKDIGINEIFYTSRDGSIERMVVA